MARRTRNGRNEQLIRLLAILRDLDRRNGCDLYELAEHHGTTVRTIRRDLEALQSAGVPLVAGANDDGRRKRWRVVYPDSRKQLAKLCDASHYMAVVTALGAGGTGTAAKSTRVALGDLANKLMSVLTPKEQLRLTAIGRGLQVTDHRMLRRIPPDVLWSMAEAIVDRRMIELDYQAINAPAPRRLLVGPMRMFASQGGLYAMVHEPKRDGILTLAMHRAHAVRITDRRSSAPQNIDIDSMVNARFGADGAGPLVRFKLRFSNVVAPHIRERQWHTSEKFRTLADGVLEMRFTCQASAEVTAWVASWRQHVEVIGPKALRDELAELGNFFVERYSEQRRKPTSRN